MYELTYIANPDLSEKDIGALNEKVRGLIVKKEGQIKNEKIGPRKQLAYQIKKQNFGYYITVDFSLKPDKAKDLSEQIKTEDKILRSLIIIKQKPKLAPPPRIVEPKPAKVMPKPSQVVSTTEVLPKKEKVKLEDLDKKLEEILEE